jgi:uncharacterized membrane protein (DUF4010 family)
MNLTILMFGLLFSLFSFSAIAGGSHVHGHGHSHAASSVNQATAQTKAITIVAGLIKKNKLAKSWASVAVNSAEKKDFKGKSEWLIIFVNNKITDKEKQKLYVFLTLGGDYIAANYTGN